MTVYQIDPDVVRWGLHLIDVCSLSNNGSPETVTFYQRDLSLTESVEEGFSNPTPYYFVDNDEVIAHALQQELSLEDENRDFLPEIEDESHVPKTNGEMPSVDEATSDHQRLLNRYCFFYFFKLISLLELYDLVELKISGDGNCQFRSLSDQIYRTPEHHKFVREQIVDQLTSQPELYDNYVPMAYGDYLKQMSNGYMGRSVTLQAAADCYGIKIFVITSFKDTCYIEILPQLEKSNRIIFLSFWAEVHYNSIYPLGGKKFESNLPLSLIRFAGP
ncbi:hypothetical protein MIMGU_mgv1a022809mg, partial [Erythranthe guttata]